MGNFSFSSVFRLTGFDLKNHRKQILGWSIAIFCMMFLYMFLFPMVKDMASAKMEAMPKQILQFMGMEEFSDMSNFTSYFGIIYSLILVAISVFGATFASKLICGEERDKTIEYLYSLRVSRSEIFVSKLITTVLAVLSVVLFGVIATGICVVINGSETVEVMDLVRIITISSFTAFFFAILALMLSGITARAGGGLASMVVLSFYLLGYLSDLLGDKGQWLAKISPFKALAYQKAMVMESETLVMLGVYVGLALVFAVVGGLRYRRRDFQI